MNSRQRITIVALVSFALGVTFIRYFSLYSSQGAGKGLPPSSSSSGAGYRGEAPAPAIIDIWQLQTMLVERGHDITIDGRLGKETIAAWGREISNQVAEESFYCKSNAGEY